MATRAAHLSPLFSAGPVRFFESPRVSPRPHSDRFLSPVPWGCRRSEFLTDYGHNVTSNEEELPYHFFPKIRGVGGTLVGVGSFQNYGMAAAAMATGLVLVDRDIGIALLHALILPQIPRHRGPGDLSNALFGMARGRGNDVKRFLGPIPPSWQDAARYFMAQVAEAERRSGGMSRCIDTLLSRSEPFFTDPVTYQAVAALVKGGRVAVVHADLFDGGTAPLMNAVLGLFPDPVRVWYVSNVPQAEGDARRVPRLAPLLRILEGPSVDPEGHLLMTTGHSAAWTYHDLKLDQAVTSLRDAGGLTAWLDAEDAAAHPGQLSVPASAFIGTDRDHFQRLDGAEVTPRARYDRLLRLVFCRLHQPLDKLISRVAPLVPYLRMENAAEVLCNAGRLIRDGRGINSPCLPSQGCNNDAISLLLLLGLTPEEVERLVGGAGRRYRKWTDLSSFVWSRRSGRDSPWGSRWSGRPAEETDPFMPDLEMALALKGRLVVLDPLAGRGRELIALAAGYPELRCHGIDLNPENLVDAARAACDRNIPPSRITFWRHDVFRSLPFDSGTVDRIIVSGKSTYGFTVEDLILFYDRVVRVARKGGRIWVDAIGFEQRDKDWVSSERRFLEGASAGANRTLVPIALPEKYDRCAAAFEIG